MTLPRSYKEVRRIVRGKVLSTHVARQIVRKSGFSGAIGPSGGGRPPIVVMRFEWWFTVTPDTGQTDTFAQYTRASSRRYNRSVGASATTTLGQQNTTGRIAEHMTRFWLGPFTEVRVVARVITTNSNLRVIGGFAGPTGDWINPPIFSAAGFADSAQAVLTGTGSAMATLTQSVSVSSWASIHSSYKALGEVRAGMFVRNTSTTASQIPEIGTCELQVR